MYKERKEEKSLDYMNELAIHPIVRQSEKENEALLSARWRVVQLMSKLETDSISARSCQASMIGLGVTQKYLNKLSYRESFVEDGLKPAKALLARTQHSTAIVDVSASNTVLSKLKDLDLPVSAWFVAAYLGEHLKSSSYRLPKLLDRLAKTLLKKSTSLAGFGGNTSLSNSVRKTDDEMDKKLKKSKSKSVSASLGFGMPTAKISVVKRFVKPSLFSSTELFERIKQRKKELDKLSYDPKPARDVVVMHPSASATKYGNSVSKSESAIESKDLSYDVLFSLIGLKVVVSGRILGAEMARTQKAKYGKTPSNSFECLKDVAHLRVPTKAGSLGVYLVLYWKMDRRIPKV